MKKELLRALPKIDYILNEKKLEKYKESVAYYTFLSCIKETIEKYRNIILKDLEDFSGEEDLKNKILIEIIEKLKIEKRKNIEKVFNCTGTIIHTNLGRSVFSKDIGNIVGNILSGYNNLEYDIETGKRGSRYKNLEKLICNVVGSEGALIVNNNAAAVVLCLNEFAKDKKVIISRGELVEIGGSFRIPEIIKFAGAKISEVGTTNRTYKEDYEKEITEETGVLMKVHTSNYKIQGFTHETTVEELAEIGKKHNIISIEDIGSGNLIEFSKYGVKNEPTIKKSLECGIDIVTFSGDKLLGGCQAGIIVGKKEYIERLKKNQFLRAVRVDKITIAILEKVFSIYQNEKEAVENIPTLRMITEKIEKVQERANKFSKILKDKNIDNEVIETKATIGGGSMPEEFIESFGILLKNKISPNKLEENFRKNYIPIIGRIEDKKFILDMKTVFEEELEELGEIIHSICKEMEM
ncbi:MAG: L-seryl-tRNA(Sec) selenium transferase [Fusobacterium perfoetens]|uniref:L-seryl-tRNA(Sec) selenium transferase n=1 Tax=Fusobacterium perfoetens TaxID=852 RepID=UPI0023F33833|nr:L-seryl-tRNA(Sec) selenium transferase [Fusobacterium perfoetens]MCI6152155.1 L-seryl-tRNA(Sec) selenium transferase [Fusobacterium perfoetens]MDY3237954.1 L-seryl-tRNA(Sec) selenium transferase [Fusobacterium perfoetens]